MSEGRTELGYTGVFLSTKWGPRPRSHQLFAKAQRGGRQLLPTVQKRELSPRRVRLQDPVQRRAGRGGPCTPLTLSLQLGLLPG